MKIKNLSLILAASVGVATAADSAHTDWPRFRGPTGDGVSLAKGIPTTWSATQNVLWSADLPRAYMSWPRDVISSDKFDVGSRLDKTDKTLYPPTVVSDDPAVLERSFQPYSSPIVSGDKVFVATAGVRVDGNRLLCFNLADGKPLWKTPGPKVEAQIYPLSKETGVHHAYGYNLATPCTDGERVYVAFGTGDLTAVDINGKVVWQNILCKDPGRPLNMDHALIDQVISSPIVYKDLVLIVVSGYLKAYNRHTGVKTYDVQIGGGNLWSTPILVTFKEKTVFLIPWKGIDPENGNTIWTWSPKQPPLREISNCSSMIFNSGLLINFGIHGAAIPVDESTTGDISAVKEKWRTSYTVPTIDNKDGADSSPVIFDGIIYKYQPRGEPRGTFPPVIFKLYCIELNTGKVTNTLDMPGLSSWTSPVATADGYVYYATGSKSYVVKTGPKPEVIGPNLLGDFNLGSSPAVVDGKLIIRGGNKLWCIGKK
jgi:outer membrane protein assembly factor BamB